MMNIFSCPQIFYLSCQGFILATDRQLLDLLASQHASYVQTRLKSILKLQKHSPNYPKLGYYLLFCVVASNRLVENLQIRLYNRGAYYLLMYQIIGARDSFLFVCHVWNTMPIDKLTYLIGQCGYQQQHPEFVVDFLRNQQEQLKII